MCHASGFTGLSGSAAHLLDSQTQSSSCKFFQALWRALNSKFRLERLQKMFKASQTDLKFAAVALNAEGAEDLAEDAKAIIFLCDL